MKLITSSDSLSLFKAVVSEGRSTFFVEVPKYFPQTIRVSAVSFDAQVTCSFQLDGEARDLLIEALQSAREAQTEKVAA